MDDGDRDKLASLEEEKLQRRLFVQEALSATDDNSVAHLPMSKMNDLRICRGETVKLRGKKRSQTVCVIIPDDTLEPDHIRLNRYSRRNLRVRVGDVISVHKTDIKDGKRIHVLPFNDIAISNISDALLFDNFLKPYFFDNHRPVEVGNVFGVTHGSQLAVFKVMATDPSPNCVVVTGTQIFCNGQRLERENEDKILDEIGYDDIGGCSKELALIREMIELPLVHPQLFDTIGVSAPKGILLFGPPGTGKTLIAKAIANETGAYFNGISGAEIMNKLVGESELNLRKLFMLAERNAPSIIFINEIDSLAPKREKVCGELEKRIVAQLLTLMDGLNTRSKVIVLAATNRPNSLDGALRRYGRFDKEIHIGIPDTQGRLEILRIHTKKMKISNDVDLRQIAAETHGHVGADLSALCQDAGEYLIRQIKNAVDPNEDSVHGAILEMLKKGVSMSNFRSALAHSFPSSLREWYFERPDVSWDDIGGLEEVKNKLRELVVYPVQYPEMFEEFGMKPARGVLFYGPPGCGKTLLAKAVANKCQANFISIKGPELFTMWLGESEANIREVFERARNAAPCILFFDEIDSLVPTRGAGAGFGNKAADRVINQMLTEMDGISSLKEVFIIGATNRPEILDPAILRPGRLGQLVYIPMPDEKTRLKIFEAILRKSPLDDDVDLGSLAQRTEGCSGADVTEICKLAGMNALRDVITYLEGLKITYLEGLKNSDITVQQNCPIKKITKQHFESAMNCARRSVTDSDIQKYESFERNNNLPKDNSASLTRKDSGFYDNMYT